MRRDVLFEDGELTEHLDQLLSQAAGMASRLDEEAINGRDDEEIVAEIAARFNIELPELHREEAELSQKESQIDVSQDVMRGIWDRSQPFYIKGEHWTLHVPYTGDSAILRKRPSQSFMTHIFGALSNSELLVSVEFPADQTVDVQRATLGQLDQIEQMISFARTDVNHFRERLPAQVAAAVVRRRAEISREKARLGNLTIPVRRASDPETQPTKAVQRKPQRPLPTHATTGARQSTARTTLAHEYEHILGVLRAYARSMERAPSSFSPTEEGRRDAMLGALETHYRGKAFAEAFNRRGKTDILIREGDHNLFISECKIWHGAGKFSEALDQLLGYATWHDSRLSLVVFVEQRDLTRVLKAAKSALELHENFGGWRAGESEVEQRCELKFPGDAAQRLQLAVLFVHLVP